MNELSNFRIAKETADDLDARIITVLSSGKSFRVEAGAGTGKTHSLTKVVDWLEHNKKNVYLKRGQKVACITFTNAAVDVIKERIDDESFIQPCTIHSFAWKLICKYQIPLKNAISELDLLPKDIKTNSKIPVDNVNSVTYDLGVKYVRDGVLHLHHNDIIKIFVYFMDNKKFRLFLGKQYPIILIDEYQDSSRDIMNQFIKYFIDQEIAPQFGLFGDAWQTIYGNNGACGEITNEKLEVINKNINYRSETIIVDALNKIRPELPQISALDSNEGRIVIITTNEYNGERVSKGVNKGELPDAVYNEYVNNVKEKLFSKGWTNNTKVLMLAHKILAKQQGYEDLLDILDNHFQNQDDEHFMFFKQLVEPVFCALEENNARKLFDSLGVERRPVQGKKEKENWMELRNQLKEARNKTIGDVVKVLSTSTLLGLPPNIREWKDIFDSGDGSERYHNGTIAKLYSIPYKQVIKGCEFLNTDAMYSTDHGVKGEQYDNVLLISGRGWNLYNFDRILPQDENALDDKGRNTFIRNRNLFYVCCSRARKRLAIMFTVQISPDFKEYLASVFGPNNLISYSDFMMS